MLPYLICAAAWLVPGAGHLWLGRVQKGLVFLVTLPVMYGIGLLLDGQIFPFLWSQPLVALAAVANFGIGAAYGVAKLTGVDAGNPIAITYEYGNSFLIVAGLLNMLVVLDVFDITQGRK